MDNFFVSRTQHISQHFIGKDTLTFILKLCSLCLLLATATQVAAEEQLQLPPEGRKVPLATTLDSSLGTLPDGIGIPPGTTLPNISMSTHLGKQETLSTLTQQQPILVVFYRGGWCPYCNVQIRKMAENYTSFQQRNVLPVFISVDKPEAAALASKTYEIPFPVLSDPKLVAHTAFNVIMEQDEQAVARYKQFGIDLEAWSGESHGSIAVSSVFLVDQTNTVRWAHAAMDYKTRPSVKQLLQVIDHFQEPTSD